MSCRAFVKDHTNMMLFKVKDHINMILYILKDNINMILNIVKDHIINIYYAPLNRQRDCPFQRLDNKIIFQRADTPSRNHIYPRARQ